MGREIVYCEKCGARILQEEFDRGEAITLHNKNYCTKCRASVAPLPEPPPPPAEDDALKPATAERDPAPGSAIRRAVKAAPPGGRTLPPTKIMQAVRSASPGGPPVRPVAPGGRFPAAGRPTGMRPGARGGLHAGPPARGAAAAPRASSAEQEKKKNTVLIVVLCIVVGALLLWVFLREEKKSPPPSRERSALGLRSPVVLARRAPLERMCADRRRV